MEDVKNDPKFWERLREHGRQTEQVKHLQLELPKPPLYRQEAEVVERGICIIEVM